MNEKSCCYSEGITNQKIAIIGIEPPPLGGVSIHITRVMDRFTAQHNRVALWPAEMRGRRFFPLYIMRLFGWLIRQRPDRLYYHATYLKSAVLELWFLKLFKKLFSYQLFIVDHDCRHLARRSAFARDLYKKIVAACTEIICIGSSVKQSYHDNGIAGEHIVVDDAFIAPSLHQAAQIRAQYPSSLTIFIKEHTPILLVSAAHLMRVDGRDIYGIDLTLEMVRLLQADYPDLGLIIALPVVVDEGYFEQLVQTMKSTGVAENVFILHGNKELWPLFKNVDIFVRPTRSDGDSISVREALFFKVPVVASDVCQRPVGVHLFKAEDAQSGAAVIGEVLKETVYGYQQHNPVHPQSQR